MVNNLHLFVVSELNKYGGGIETWINYFLQNFDLTKISGKIFVYHKKPSEDHWLNKEEDYANDYCDCVDEEGCYKPNGGKNMYHCPPY